MVFIESSIFTGRLSGYLEDDSYRELQAFLADRPDAGAIIRGTGGLRKVRWAASGHGKRGGVRIIYYWRVVNDQILLMTLYAKNEVADLGEKEKSALKEMLKRWNNDQT